MKRALLPLLALLGCSTENVFEPPDYGLERMLSQPRYDPYERSGFFADGRVMQHPPEGTVPATDVPWSAEAQSGEAAGALVRSIPLELTGEEVRRGRERYDIFCAPCHGILGDGNAVVGRNMPLVRPRSLVTGDLRTAPPGRIFRAIEMGYGLMGNYRAQLDLRERWAVVAYVQALQLSQSVALETLPEALQREARGALR